MGHIMDNGFAFASMPRQIIKAGTSGFAHQHQRMVNGKAA